MDSLIDKISQFVNTYYLDPIRTDSGYNPVNTFTWAVILGICIFGVFKLLKKLEVKMTPRFIVSVLPFVLAGSSLRVIEDSPADLVHPPFSYLLITPNIYFLVFVITVGCLWVSIRLQKAGLVKDFHSAFASFGLVWFFINLIILLHFQHVVTAYIPLFVIGAGTGLTFAFYLIARYFKSSIFTDPLNLSILLIHLMDASSTYIGVDKFGYFSKHVVPSYLINLTGTALIMYPLKLIIFIGVIYILDTQFEEDELSLNLKMLIKMVILILGLSTAARDTIRMTLGI
jgi:Predicted membrane protein